VSASLDAPIHPKPLTRDGFAPFGDVLQAFPDPKTRWEGQDIQVSPDGKTTKYARLADITSTYPADSNAVSGISVFRATPKVGLTRGKVFDVRFFERHPYTSQAFVPMGKGEVSLIVWDAIDLASLIRSGRARGKKRSRREARCSSLSRKTAQTTSPTPRRLRRSSCPRRWVSATRLARGVSRTFQAGARWLVKGE
jgi:ureidoglycolate hydrolase